MFKKKRMKVTFEGPCINAGVSLDDVHKALKHVHNAVELMVMELTGDFSKGHPCFESSRHENSFRLKSSSSGALTAELVVSGPANGQQDGETYHERAFERILGWKSRTDVDLPYHVADELRSIGNGLSEEVDAVWLGDDDNSQMVKIERQDHETSSECASYIENAILHGWLKEVNRDEGVAELHRYRGRHVELKFGSDLQDDMRQLATQYVEVRGSGYINAQDRWEFVNVSEVNATRSGFKPFDLDAFLNNLDPQKVFDPENVVTVSEPFDVDAFLKEIYDARKAGRSEVKD